MISGGFFDIDELSGELTELENKMGQPDFWDKKSESQIVISRVSEIKNIREPYLELKSKFNELKEMYELYAEEGSDDEIQEILRDVQKFEKKLASFEIESKLCDELDPNNAIVSINAGAGGTESCDWASMLLRMYLRWAESRGFKVEMMDMLSGEEAGVKNCVFLVKGKYAFGYLKCERGVHRLVRISPFDSNKRRHTSFASVDISAEITDDIIVDIREEDLKVDTYRSSGAGGQHVNTTDSAVRITHIPSGIVVASQTDRSQHKNKANAMKLLKARLYEKTKSEKESLAKKDYSEKDEIGWGSQIRSYVFAPYQLVKDHRTKEETGNIIAVMDGAIDNFMEAYLQQM